MIPNPVEIRTLVQAFRAEHRLVCEALEQRCRVELGLPVDIELGDVASALLNRRLAEAIAEYRAERSGS